MRKLYGDALRKDAGVTKTLRNVAARNAHVLSGVTRGVKEVHGTFEKVLEETAEALEEFLSRCTYNPRRSPALADLPHLSEAGPRLHNYVEDTKILLKQSGERFVIRFALSLRASQLSADEFGDSRVANNMREFDLSQYALAVRFPADLPNRPRASTCSGPPRFHLGEAITVGWSAAANHSAQDWIGIYRLDANSSRLVTSVSSQGKWCAVHEDQTGPLLAEGEVRFAGRLLPWAVGKYEFRYDFVPRQI